MNDNEKTDTRKRLDNLLARMKQQRRSHEDVWMDIGTYICPDRVRWLTGNSDRGLKKDQEILDSTATAAGINLSSGMMSGVTSPARPWFRLTTPYMKINEDREVKNWLTNLTNTMSTMFLKSNLYNVLPDHYENLGHIGTAATLMEEDFERFVRFISLPIGSYWIANDHKLKVSVFARQYQMTVRQIIEKFGLNENGDPISLRKRDKQLKIHWGNMSTHVKTLYEEGYLEEWVTITHIIEPNYYYNPNKKDALSKKYASYYYESGQGEAQYSGLGTYSDSNISFLRISGFDYFPVLATRWSVSGEDVYGTGCPGRISLSDVKELQFSQKVYKRAIDKMVDPPMKANVALKYSKPSIMPGDMTYVTGDIGDFKPTHTVDLDLRYLMESQAEIRDRIRRNYSENLFLQMISSDRRTMTAAEVDARRQEKMLALVQVFENISHELLDPLINNMISMMAKREVVPPPPRALQSVELKVEYISIMAQAQKLVGLGNIERFTEFSSALAQLNPEILDKIDFDQIIDIYGDINSLPSGIIKSDKEALEQRRKRSEELAKQKQLEQEAQEAQVGKIKSEIKKDSIPNEEMDYTAGAIASANLDESERIMQ